MNGQNLSSGCSILILIHLGNSHQAANREDRILQIDAPVLVDVGLGKAEGQEMKQEKWNNQYSEDPIHGLPSSSRKIRRVPSIRLASPEKGFRQYEASNFFILFCSNIACQPFNSMYHTIKKYTIH
jgi:hypothetical protein